MLDFTRKAGVIFSILDHDRTGLDRSLRLPMKPDPYIADLGKPKMLARYGKPALRVSEGVVPTFRLESREARFFSTFDAAKELGTLCPGALQPVEELGNIRF